MVRLTSCAVLAVACAVASPQPSPPSDAPGGASAGGTLEAVVLAASDCTGDIAETEPGRRVLTDPESFRTAFLRTQQAEVAVPVVDFERYSVLALFRGRRPQCGSTIGASLRDVGARVEITVTARNACGGDDAVAYPFAFLRIPRSSKPYVFLERTEAARCE